MSTVIDLVKFAASTVGDISDEMIDFGRVALRLKYKSLYDSHLWRESLRVIYSQLDPDLGGVFFLPYDCEEVIFFSISHDGQNFVRLNYRERDWMERNGGSMLSVPGGIPSYYRAENLAWPYFGPGKFTFTSYDTGIFTLYVAGADVDGNQIAETYKMQGVINPGDNTVNPAVVTTLNSFYTVTALSKGATQTSLSVQPQFPVGGIQTTMTPEVSELVFTQLALAPTPVLVDPNSGDPINIPVRLQVKIKADALNSDYSVPRISHVTDALAEFTMAAMYKKARQFNKSDSCEQKGIAHVQAAVQIEKSQSEMRQQVVPTIYDPGDYLALAYNNQATSSYAWGW